MIRKFRMLAFGIAVIAAGCGSEGGGTPDCEETELLCGSACTDVVTTVPPSLTSQHWPRRRPAILAWHRQNSLLR